MSQLKLDGNTWKNCIKSMPVFGIDLIVFTKEKGILMGKRKNNPAKDSFFVPGGRVYKNEQRSEAFSRILKTETGLSINFERSKFIGIFEHFYNVTYWSNEESTHYIIEARFIDISNQVNQLNIDMDEQHVSFKWFKRRQLSNINIHNYSRIYFDNIEKYTN